MASNRPILVTGSMRAGTTWVGRMIAKSPQVGYIHEPFNPWHNRERQGMCRVPVPHWFLYINDENGALYQDPVARMLSFRYSLVGGVAGIRSWGDVKRVLREYGAFRRHRATNARALVKDPFALFSAEWLARNFDMEVIVMIRHPAAIVSSIKRLGWGSPFRHLLRQPALMRDHLSPFRSRLEEYATEKQDIVDQTILIWNILYAVVTKYQQEHPDWLFIRHEDIASDPLTRFGELFARLELPFSPQVQAAVQKSSAPSNPVEIPVDKAYTLQRDSRAVIKTWKDRLSAEEIEWVREGTRNVARAFYTEEDW